MATIHPKPTLVTVLPDGDGGQTLRIYGRDGVAMVLPLTLDECVRLSFEIARAAHHLAQPLEKRVA